MENNENTTIPSETSSFLSPFKSGLFITIWMAALFSDLGLWMQSVGASWVLAKETTSPIYLTLMVTATSMPVFLLGLPSGALSDIFNKRNILLMTQGWMSLIAISLFVMVFLGYTNPVFILILTFFLALGPAINDTVWQSAVHDVVPEKDLPAAIVLNGVSINLARAIGPALGGLVISFYDPVYVFLINAIFFLVTFVMIYQWKTGEQGKTLSTERFTSAIRIGYNYVRYNKVLHPILVVSFAFSIGASAVFALLPTIVIQELGENGSVYGIMLFALGLGAIMSAISLPSINRNFNMNQKMIFSGICLILNLIAFQYTQNLYVMGLALFISGFGWLVAMSSFNVAIQTNVPKWVLSSAISIYIMIFQGGMALGGILWGTLATKISVLYALIFAAVCIIITLLLLFRFSLKDISIGQFTASIPLPFVQPALTIENDEGPVMVSREYSVVQDNIKAFTEAIEDLKFLRMRNGASQIGFFQDVLSPTLITEYYLVESWSQYKLQIERYTVEDREIEANILSFHALKKLPKERIMLSQIEHNSVDEINN